MPPPKHPPPPVQLRALPEASKRSGLDFDAAWADALAPGRIKHAHDTGERRGWKEALTDTRDEWRAAYLDQPTAVSELLARIVLDRTEPRASGELLRVA